MARAGGIKEFEAGNYESVSANGLLLGKVVIARVGNAVTRETFSGVILIMSVHGHRDRWILGGKSGRRVLMFDPGSSKAQADVTVGAVRGRLVISRKMLNVVQGDVRDLEYS